jgi:hypothetical protein
VHLLPVSTNLPLYLISTPIPNVVNTTSHPALHSFTTDNSTYFAKPGIMWQHSSAIGGCGRSRSSMCVNYNWSPFDKVTDIGLFATFLLRTGALRTKTWLIVPESNISHFLMCCRLISTVRSRFSGRGAELCTFSSICCAACVYTYVSDWVTHGWHMFVGT